MTILRTRLEHQLISAISTNLLDPRLEQERLEEFKKQLQARIELEQKAAAAAASNGPALQAERSELERQGRNLADAIAQNGSSPFLASQLAKVDARPAEIDRLSNIKPATKLPAFTDEEIRNFIQRECKEFCELLKADPEIARREIQKRMPKLVLTPRETPGGAVLEVSGDIELLRTGDVLDESPLERTAQQYIKEIRVRSQLLVSINPEPRVLRFNMVALKRFLSRKAESFAILPSKISVLSMQSFDFEVRR